MNRQLSIRTQQVAVVLNLVRRYQPVCRADVRFRSGIRLGTVGSIIRHLAREGLVAETRLPAPNRRGRRRGMLVVNPSGRLAAGVELARGRVRGVLMNIEGAVLHRTAVAVGESLRAPALRAAVEGVVEALLAAAPRGARVAGIGFVDPGIVDPENGLSLYSTLFPHWRDVPIRSILSERFGLPVHLSNTPQAKAVAEFLFGTAKGRSDFIFIEFGEGLACGIYSGGRLVTGAGMMAGEFGHTHILGRDDPCECGGRGCLEALVSLRALGRRVRELPGGDRFRPPAGDPRPVDLPAVFKAYETGDRPVVRLLDEAAGFLGLGAANLVNMLNPSLVVFDGRFRETGGLFLRRVEERLREGILKGEERRLEITVSGLGEEIGAVGGGGLVIEDVFALPGLVI